MITKVLLIENNIIRRYELRKVLGQLGCEMESVVNGLLAVEVLQRDAFDVVILNPHIPLLNGVDAAKRIREIRSKAQLPILAMVAGYDTKQAYEYALAGINDLVYAPATAASLGEVLGKWIPGYTGGVVEYLATGSR